MCKQTDPNVLSAFTTLHQNRLVSESVMLLVEQHHETFQEWVDTAECFEFDYFGFKTLEKSYLLRDSTGKILERLPYLFLRVAIGIHANDLANVESTFRGMYRGLFIHATPTLFNAGTPFPQMSSCFLVKLKSDSIIGIYDTLKECALISKSAGGIGFHVSNVRGKGSYIGGTKGKSNGLVRSVQLMLCDATGTDASEFQLDGSLRGPRGRQTAWRLCSVLGAMVLHVGRRDSTFRHPDVFDFVQLRRNTGAEESRCRDLHLALWVQLLIVACF